MKRPPRIGLFPVQWGLTRGLLLTALLVTSFNLAMAQASPPQSTESQKGSPAELDLEQLAQMDITVTSATKKEESLFTAPAAIYVITHEDIRRSGLSSLPELLRTVPGMTVQQVNSHSWSISTRGFNGFPNEKMLVLIDGRAVYDLLFGGVYWDAQDLRLEDVERIEVIRGPGGALWGENAVNGVINVITRNAKQTQGVSLASSLGHDEGYQGSARFGGQVGKSLYYRVFGKSSYWDPTVDSDGAEQPNAWNLSMGGFRADWDASSRDRVMIEGSGYQGHVRDTALLPGFAFTGNVPDIYAIQGGHVLGRWDRTFSSKSSLDVYGYSDWTNRTDLAFAGAFRNTLEFGFQHNYEINPRNSLIWGSSFRTTSDQTRYLPGNSFTPADKREHFTDGFAQYEFQIVPQRLRLIAGSKFGHNSGTGFELQPQVRAVWTPSKDHTVWGSISRSVRTPTRNETDHEKIVIYVPGNPPLVTATRGVSGLKAEHQTAYELGYRYQLKGQLSLDAAAFYNSYSRLLFPDSLHAITTANPDPPLVLVLWPFTNGERAQSHGLEVSGDWHPVSIWHLNASLTEDRGTGRSMTATSRHLFTVASHLNLPRSLELDSALYHVNGYSGRYNFSVPTSNRVDVGLTWRSRYDLSLGAWGRNLQSDRHPEGLSLFTSTGQARRSVVFKLTWDPGSEKHRSGQ
jgi:iron complex outermembrane receptor protein